MQNTTNRQIDMFIPGPTLEAVDGLQAFKDSKAVPAPLSPTSGQSGSRKFEGSQDIPISGPTLEAMAIVALDWAHTRQFAIYDGKKAYIADFSAILKMEGIIVAIENGAPLAYLYPLRARFPVRTVNAQRVAERRAQLGIAKDDLADAKVIYDLADAGEYRSLSLDDNSIRLAYLMHQWRYAQKAEFALNNLKKAMQRHWPGDSNATTFKLYQHISEWSQRSDSLRKDIEILTPPLPQRLSQIKGFSPWLWAGILVFADPRRFHSKSAYKLFCGYTNKEARAYKGQNGRNYYKKSRAASTIYWKIIDSFIKQQTPDWVDFYYSQKEILSAREGYTHPHSGAVNRVATRFACFVYDVMKENGVDTQSYFL